MPAGRRKQSPHKEFTNSARQTVPKDKVINFRIDPELKKQAKRLAADDQRSLSNWITWLIQREVKRAAKKT